MYVPWTYGLLSSSGHKSPALSRQSPLILYSNHFRVNQSIPKGVPILLRDALSKYKCRKTRSNVLVAGSKVSDINSKTLATSTKDHHQYNSG